MSDSETASKTRYCREYWSGDSKDGHYLNGDGYHYFEMKPSGVVLDAYEYYETDEGEERSTRLSEFIGINWFETFGFEDDEILEDVPLGEFEYVKNLCVTDDKPAVLLR